MRSMFTEEAKKKAKELVHHFETDGNGESQYDELVLAAITTEGVDGEIEVGGFCW